jgi:hypothetical protein
MLLVGLFAVPSVALTWWLTSRADWTLSGCLLLFALESPFCGSALVAAAGLRVFGEEFSPLKGLREFSRRLIVLLWLLPLVRLLTIGASVFLVIPAYMIASRYGFLAEILLLEKCRFKQFEKRLSDLMNETYMDLCGRLVALFLFFSISVGSLFVVVDVMSGTLLGWPVLVGRISGLAHIEQEIFTLFTRDPRVATVLVAVCWLVYPVARLAWLFCYLDIRIRKEGWDVELDFRVEAQRLEAA